MMKSRELIVLGIETSCDETSAAVLKNGREVLSNVINSQIDIHKVYGGVVPEIASRAHTEVISGVVRLSLKEANITFEDIDVIACTYGPGLIGALLVGVSYAKGLSYSLEKPLIAVNHIEGHIAANYITHKDLKPPFLCLIISGGHTHLVHVKDYTKFEILGKTRDDAIGEAFDKVARVIGLGYPGGPKIDKLAKEGEANIDLPTPKLKNVGVGADGDPNNNFDFSFSGLKTAILNLYHKNPDINKADLCMSFEKTAADILIDKTFGAATKYGIDTIVLAGGVSANTYIRDQFKHVGAGFHARPIQIYYPDIEYCTDNAAMIASAGYYRYLNGDMADLKLNAVANLKI